MLVGETTWISWYKITSKDTSQTIPFPEETAESFVSLERNPRMLRVGLGAGGEYMFKEEDQDLLLNLTQWQDLHNAFYMGSLWESSAILTKTLILEDVE